MLTIVIGKGSVCVIIIDCNLSSEYPKDSINLGIIPVKGVGLVPNGELAALPKALSGNT
jgi:hypothetical protein